MLRVLHPRFASGLFRTCTGGAAFASIIRDWYLDHCYYIYYSSTRLSYKAIDLFLSRAPLDFVSGTVCRAKVSERLLQLALFDAQARSSRVSMLLPGSLLLAETELR